MYLFYLYSSSAGYNKRGIIPAYYQSFHWGAITVKNRNETVVYVDNANGIHWFRKIHQLNSIVDVFN
jgi:hypothetical protein